MKNGVILVMSCNEERFIEEEEIIRKTWGSPIINGEVENLSIIFYRGGSGESFDDEKKVLYLNVPDDLSNTYNKTIEAFKFLEKNNIEYDYIFKTNTSTYVNVEALLQFLKFEDIDKETVYAPGLNINQKCLSIPFGIGYFLIFPKYMVESIFIRYALKSFIDNGVDDVNIGFLMATLYKDSYVTKHLKQIDVIDDFNEFSIKDFTEAYCVRIKDDKNLKNNCERMLRVHHLYNLLREEVKVKRPHNFTNIYTSFGKIPIEKHD